MTARPHAPRPSPEQSALIDALGGPKVVAALVSRRIGLSKKPLTPQAVSMWRSRGIPYRYRFVFARLATERGIAVPSGFLGEEAEEPDEDVPAFLREA